MFRQEVHRKCFIFKKYELREEVKMGLLNMRYRASGGSFITLTGDALVSFRDKL
jgi:hypothetical protein